MLAAMPSTWPVFQPWCRFGVLTDDREGVTCELSTDATQGADQLDEHRAFWWVRVNAEEIDDQGTLNVLAHEYEEGFDPTGEPAPLLSELLLGQRKAAPSFGHRSLRPFTARREGG